MCNMLFRNVVLLFFVLESIDAVYYTSGSCPTPRLEHGRVRLRQRSRLVRFACFPPYTLVGSRYATCRNGYWDVPMPICVRPSCSIPTIQNGISVKSHEGAWVIFFCLPKFKLVGSPTIYCDGVKWNSSAPTCIDTTAGPALSCDFEDPGLCGWRQDEFHDFDWLRLNSKTPSSFLLTGPSFDHTLGEGNNGHYMYIESTSQLKDETARLISPLYDSSLSSGCFSFAYHMYGRCVKSANMHLASVVDYGLKPSHCVRRPEPSSGTVWVVMIHRTTTIGGLRVYQKPDDLSLRRMLELGQEQKRNYLLFEKWGNLGDIWFNSISPLKKTSVDFQIVIEGIRGTSYTSDIAIDDVAILQGENCTEAAKVATTPSTIMPDSCVGRCFTPNSVQDPSDARCSCTVICFVNETCCPDFFDICIFTPDSTLADTNVPVTGSSEAEPQTLKLVAGSTETTTSSSSSTTSTTTTTTPPPTTTTTKRITTTTTKRRPTSSRTTPKSKSTSTTTSRTSTTATTTTKRSTTRKPITPSTKTNSYKPPTTAKTTPKTIPRTYVIPITTKRSTTSFPVTYDDILESDEKAKKEVMIEKKIEAGHKSVTILPEPQGMSVGSKTALVIMVLVMLTVAALVVHAGLRTTRGRIVLARLRGHRERDSEVRYLTSDVDDD